VHASPGSGFAADTLPFDDARSVARDDLDDLLEPRTPLLARAFAGLRHL
jgi:hypothetical protein